ncbi:MAG: LysM peptidoglycan-binding domain-containing protein [Verrucomicrobiota bacterium]
MLPLRIAKLGTTGLALGLLALAPLTSTAESLSSKKRALKQEQLAKAVSVPSQAQVNAKVKAKAFLLTDAKTGEVLLSRNARDRHPPASTVKLMTILVAYEQLGGPRGEFEVLKSDRAEPSNVPLIPGEIVQVEDMMPAVLLGSDNDAARALARHAGGNDYDRFIQLMNKKALELGCRRTVFKNPNGLPIDGQYTTCEDLMKIFHAAIAVPEIREWARTKYFTLKTKARTQRVKNHNRLLGVYDGMDAAKTGWTYASRHTYAASVKRDGHELHLTLLNSPNKWIDSRVLFDYGLAVLDAREAEAASARLQVVMNEGDIPTARAVPMASRGPEEKKAPGTVIYESTSVDTLENNREVERNKAREAGYHLKPYIVKKGDTLYDLCRNFQCKIDDVLRVNLLKDPSKIYPGQKLMFPVRL